MSSYYDVKGNTSEGEVLKAIKGMQQTLQMDNDALAILGKGPILVSGEEGLRDIRIVEAAFKSVDTKQRVVI
jgi:glucose-fructose oxidoreductase